MVRLWVKPSSDGKEVNMDKKWIEPKKNCFAALNCLYVCGRGCY